MVRFIHRYWGGGDILMVKGRRTSYKVMEWIPDSSFWLVTMGVSVSRPSRSDLAVIVVRAVTVDTTLCDGRTDIE